jgi:hypothetical protein
MPPPTTKQFPRAARCVSQRAARSIVAGCVEDVELSMPSALRRPRQFRRIADRAQPVPVDAFHDLSVADVEARDDPFREHLVSRPVP